MAEGWTLRHGVGASALHRWGWNPVKKLKPCLSSLVGMWQELGMRAVVIGYFSATFPDADARLDWNWTEYGLY